MGSDQGTLHYTEPVLRETTVRPSRLLHPSTSCLDGKRKSLVLCQEGPD